MKNLIKILCKTCGLSGKETEISKLIIEKINKFCEYKVDNIGNIIAFKKGEKSSKHKIVLVANMDEAGFLVSNITSCGNIKLVNVGDIDNNVLIGKTLEVYSKSKVIPGVIGTKPIHLQNTMERNKRVKLTDLELDIGCNNREETTKLIELGSPVYFTYNFEEFKGKMIKAKAMDNRAGCAILMNLLQNFEYYNFYAIFCSLGKIDNAGAKVAIRQINPDVAIIIECTPANNFLCGDNSRSCMINKGPAISFISADAIYDKYLIDLAFEVAKKEKINVQYKRSNSNIGTAAAICSSGRGIKTLAVGIPIKYLYSPSCIVSLFDIEETVRLLKSILTKL